MRLKNCLVVLLMLVTAHATVNAQSMLSDIHGNIWDIDLATGQVSNQRSGTTGEFFIDLVQAGDKYYTMTTTQGSNFANTLCEVDTYSGQVTPLGDSGVEGIIEGDLAYNAADGWLYGVGLTSSELGISTRHLFKVSLSGEATVIGSLSGNDYSGLAFDGLGKLWAFDNSDSKLLELNLDTGSVLSSVNCTIPVSNGDGAGMEYDPATDTMYVATGITAALYTVDTSTGIFTLVGNTGLGFGEGAAGLVVPEPASLGLLLAGAAMTIRRRRRI